MRPLSVPALCLLPVLMGTAKTASAQPTATISLPQPNRAGTMTLERALSQRRSVRTFGSEPLSLADVSQILWATQGITHREGYRTAPSAGALYPLDVYLTAGRIDGLASGTYRYRPRNHALVKTGGDDLRAKLARAALGQEWVREGAAVVVLTATYERTTQKYGDRGIRYAHMEAGHAAQNLCLQATALGLGTVMVGAFDDRTVQRLLSLPEETHPIALLPVGPLP